MADLTIYNQETGEDKTEITPTNKRGRPRKGGDLSTLSKSQSGGITSLNFDENSIQNVSIISQAYGADFLPQLYDRLKAEAMGQRETFDQTQALEEALTISRHLNVERAEKLGREKGSRQMELRQLIKLKKEADDWMDNQFEDMVIHYATIGLSYPQIVGTMKDHAAKLHIDLVNFSISPSGQWSFPDYKFVHEDKIQACKSRLAELGVELDKLKELGVDVS